MKEEPSVLDYLKARLNPWHQGTIEFPNPPSEADGEQSAPAEPPPAPGDPVQRLWGRFPWLAVASLAAALYAQAMLEPPNSQPTPAAVMYLFSLILLGVSIWRGQWLLPQLPAQATDQPLPEPSEEQPAPQPSWFDPGQFRLWPLAASGIAALLAFFTFGNGVFDPINTTLWLVSIGLFIYSCWKTDLTFSDAWLRVRGWLQRPNWQITVTRGGLLLLILWGAVLYFRLAALNDLPAEPFSDQAEKLMDVQDVMNGQAKIFFDRNTGREFFQFHYTAFLAGLLGTGASFFVLKLGTALAGIFTMPYVYLIGKELANKRVALFLLVLAGLAYWPNVISRIGLRFPFYPLFAAPVLYYLLRGLRSQNRNDFILSGLFLGLGLHGYSPFRFVPFVVLFAVLVYLLHKRSGLLLRQTLTMLGMLVVAALLVFLPLLRYSVDHPDLVAFRSLSRIATTEQPYPDNPLVILGRNLLNSSLMMNVDNNNIWVHSVPDRPALEAVTGALFVLGYALVLWRYIRTRDWRDLFLLLGLHLLMMPSTLSLAFPDENPSLNRAGGAYIVVFVIAAMALDGLYTAIREKGGARWAAGIVSGLLLISALANHNIIFEKFYNNFRYSAWNTSDLAEVTDAFVRAGNRRENVWVVAYPHWVDTRLVGVWLGDPYYNPVIWRDQLGETLPVEGSKMFFVKEEDAETLDALRNVYPQGVLGYYTAPAPLVGKNFWIFTVPSSVSTLPLP